MAYVDTGSVTRNHFDKPMVIDTATEKLPSRARRKVEDGDVIYSTVRPNQLHYGLVCNPPSNMLVSTGFTVARDSVGVGGPFIYLALTRPSITAKLQSVAEQSTSAYPSIKSSDLEQLEIPMPTKDEIEEIKPQLDSLFAAIAHNEYESKMLEELRDTLLPKLMSGEIDVSQIELPMQPNNHLFNEAKISIFAHHVSIHFSHLAQLALKMDAAIHQPKRRNMEATINSVLAQMQPFLNGKQLKQLKQTLTHILINEQISHVGMQDSDLLDLFLTAKEVEGCSPRTISYYESTLVHMSKTIAKPYTQIDSNDLRKYLSEYEVQRNASKVTIDNIRRILSSFFSWLEDEDYIVKSPVRRIRRVKTATVAKETLSDEDLESLRDHCSTIRDLAIVNMLTTTGMRIGELVRLDIADINLQERECVVTGKGNKQRPVYFDARTKLHLQSYLKTRNDDSPALFVSLGTNARRLSIGGIESRLRKLGKACGIHRVHPHKFRRTLATHAIDKGMPIEQVQKLLGHARIDTTMHYALVNQSNVKTSHRRFIA